MTLLEENHWSAIEENSDFKKNAAKECAKITLQHCIDEFTKFYFESGEDYNLWDEEIEPYPATRILDAMKNKLNELQQQLSDLNK